MAGQRRKVGYAVVGLGHIAQVAVLPAFAHAGKNSRLVALVSGDRRKREVLGKRYRVRAWDYRDLDECLDSPEVDAVYICLPNSMHKESAVRAARAGVHVLCEKPMATTGADCEAMICVCREA